MNQSTTSNPSFTNNSSDSTSLSPLVASDAQPVAPADSSVPKIAKRRSKSTPIASARNAAATNVVAKTDARCRHYTFTGRRCRLAVLDPVSGLCFRHIGRQFQLTDQDLSSAFGSLSRLNSASGIYAFLTQVAVLLVQNRISTKRAAVLSYLGQTLLRALPAIEAELQSEEPQIVFDLPRPKRDDPVDPDPPVTSREEKTHSCLATSVPDSSSSPLSPNPSSPDSTSTNEMPASTTPPHLLPGFGKPANWDALIPKGRALSRRHTAASIPAENEARSNGRANAALAPSNAGSPNSEARGRGAIHRALL